MYARLWKRIQSNIEHSLCTVGVTTTCAEQWMQAGNLVYIGRCSLHCQIMPQSTNSGNLQFVLFKYKAELLKKKSYKTPTLADVLNILKQHPSFQFGAPVTIIVVCKDSYVVYACGFDRNGVTGKHIPPRDNITHGYRFAMKS